MTERVRRLCVVSHVVHYRHRGRLFAYGAYTREMDQWARLFPELVLVVPCRDAPPPGDACPFESSRVEVRAVPELGGARVRDKVRSLVHLPGVLTTLWRAGVAADALHVRCPGNLGLLGALLGRFLSPLRVAKYAGQWGGYEGEPPTFRLQRRILRSRWWGAPVTVYGEWPEEPAHVIPFFTSVLSDDQLERAEVAVRRRSAEREGPPRLLFVGRLSRQKNVGVLLDAMTVLRRKGKRCPLTVVGDGPRRESLEEKARALHLDGAVRFLGAVPFEDVLAAYETHDVLVLASETEGWPKAIAEAMAFGLVCIGPDRGMVPSMLADGRGWVVEPGDVRALATVLEELLDRSGGFAEVGRAASEWARRYSLTELRRGLADVLEREWGVVLTALDEGG